MEAFRSPARVIGNAVSHPDCSALASSRARRLSNAVLDNGRLVAAVIDHDALALIE
jgi:hypothetical protein